MTTPEEIQKAIDEAYRFIDAADVARHAFTRVSFKEPVEGSYLRNEDSKATAAMKRASMDLTRALVAVRK